MIRPPSDTILNITVEHSDRDHDPLSLREALEAERRARLRLRATHAATRVLATAAGAEEGLVGVLSEVCRTLEFQWAGFWIPTAGGVLACNMWHQDPSLEKEDFTTASRRLTFARGKGLPGRVWESGRASWIPELALDANFARATAAASVGLVGGFGIPIAVDGVAEGVMEFFANRAVEPNEELLESMAALGGQIGLFLSRRRAEQALRESEERFRAFAENVADAAFVIDEESRIVFANSAVERIFGYSPDSVIGQPLTVLIPEQLRAAHRRGVRRYLETGQRSIPWEGIELPALHKDGTQVPVEIAFGTYTIAGRRFFTGMVRDITERLQQKELLENTAAELETAVDELRSRSDEAEHARGQAESSRAEAERANRAKSDFLAVISHELRTPLNAIIGYTDLLLSGIPEALPHTASKHVDRVAAASRHLLKLIEDILSLSRVESGGEVLRLEPVDLLELVSEVASMIEPLAARKRLALRVDIPNVTIDSDPAKLRQILLNLLSNAVKFTDRGEIEVVGRFDDGALLLQVRDTGVGILAEHLMRVFDPFWQVETVATRRQGGTGLGLSVSRRLAQLMGGDIHVVSVYGTGTTFTVLLPPISTAGHVHGTQPAVPDAGGR